MKKAYLKKIMGKTVSLDLFLWLRGSPACFVAKDVPVKKLSVGHYEREPC
ncbi:hypothetical protein [Succinimonas amylolytica]